MAKRKKRVAARKAKLKRGSAHSKTRKKVAKRPAPKKAKKTARPSKPGLAKRARERQQGQPATPTVEDTIIDVVDEPVPGVLRVTEIEEISVAVPDADEDDEEE